MKRLLALLLTLLICSAFCLLPVSAAESVHEFDAPAAEKISVTAYAAILVDMDSGKTLYAYQADETNYPASTTKIMTAYLCLKYGNMQDEITVSSSAFSDLSLMASTGGLVEGETMTVYRLLQSLLVVSASEAANVVGEYISGTHEAFVDLMNEEAQALGCTNTHFTNCHGLPNPDHYTTAQDLSIIARAAMEYPEFREIVGSAKIVMEATNLHAQQTVTSTNGLLPGSSYPAYSYPYAIGIKTGHTSVAGYCLVSAAEKEGIRLLCVVMGCATRTASFTQTTHLFDWGFDNYDALTYGQEVADPSLPDPETTEDPLLETETPEDEDFSSIVSLAPTVQTFSISPTSAVSPSAISPAPSSVSPGSGSTLVPVFLCFGIAAVLVVLLIAAVAFLLKQNK